MDMMEVLTLEELTEDLGPSYMQMVDEFEATSSEYPYNNVPLARSDFAAFVRELEDEKQGIGLPPGIEAQTTYVLVRNGEIVLGEFRFRPTVPPPYLSNNGHVGYNVRPSERRKGYAARGLMLVLNKARELGLEGLMIPINSENIGSIRTTEKNGGILWHQDPPSELGEITSWYWVKL